MSGNFRLEGEAREKYAIKRSYRYGKHLHVYKAYKVDDPKAHYVIKSYRTEDAFERESRMLKRLIGTKNIMQMVDNYPSQLLSVCECALYDLGTFLGHQDYIQRHQEKGDIIKDIVSALFELQRHEIVHNDLCPQNVMFFQEDDGAERWKLIDFDAASHVNSSDYVKFITNYSAPEVVKAYRDKSKAKTSFATDIFSFGLILYYIETGHHYWDGTEKIEEMISDNNLLLRDIRDHTATLVIKELVNKKTSRRMTLENFTKKSYYIDINRGVECDKSDNRSSSEKANGNYDEFKEADEARCQPELIQEEIQAFFKDYHDEMIRRLRGMENKIDDCMTVVETLSELTKKIPQLLVKLKNEQVPRVFVMIPDRKDWKKPASWMSRPFRLLFVCEHKEKWHVPEQEGYKVLEVPQFIKKYGPWINLCLQALSGVMKMATSNIFPDSIAEILSSVFSIPNNYNPILIKYIQEIIDTVDIGVNTIVDETPEFVPLDKNGYSVINDAGLQGLKKFLKTQDCEDHLGGLIQCYDEETQGFLWLCEEHRHQYKPISQSQVSSPTGTLTPITEPSPQPSKPNTPPIDSSQISLRELREFSCEIPRPLSSEESSHHIWDYSKFDRSNLTQPLGPLDPFLALEYVVKILGIVLVNAVASKRKHFRVTDISKIARDITDYKINFEHLCPRWNNNYQKLQFIGILKNQVHLYTHFLILIVRYFAAKDDVSTASFVKQMSLLYNDIFEIDSIIKAGFLFNSHLDKLITALSHKNDETEIQNELEGFDSIYDEDTISVNFDYEALSRWHHAVVRTFIENVESPSIEIQGGELFDTKKQILDNCKIVAGKSLKYHSSNNILCIEKEIHVYNAHQLNNNEHIIQFYGYVVKDCRMTLFYDYANRGDLFEYFQSSDNLLKDWKEKVKLSWKISQGVKHLHDNFIIHLCLRSVNILLNYDEKEQTLVPKISNFLWSRHIHSQTTAHPKVVIPLEEQVWKRWHDPERLSHNRTCNTLFQPSDIYSLGLLFWEIACCKPDNLPFKEVPIAKLSRHLRSNNHEELPEMPTEYRNWEHLIKNMWQFKYEDRYDIKTVESTMQKLCNASN